MREPQNSVTDRCYVKSIFDCTEAAQVLGLVNEFLSDFATSRSAHQIPRELCPARIRSIAELENWLIPLRTETQRQEGQRITSNPALSLLKGVLDAASRQIQMFMNP
jgi:hypothetical protein